MPKVAFAMPNLRLTPRTQQLADAREIVVGHTSDGTPVWTTFGSKRMTPGDNEALSANLAAQRYDGMIRDAMHKVQAAAALFIEAIIVPLMPDAVRESYAGSDNGELCASWFLSSGLAIRMDGLRCLVLRNGQVLAEMAPVRIPAALEHDVLAALKFDQTVAAIEDAARKQA